MCVAVVYVPVVAGALRYPRAVFPVQTGHAMLAITTMILDTHNISPSRICWCAVISVRCFRCTGVFDEPRARRPCCPDGVDGIAKATCAAVGLSSLLKGKDLMCPFPFWLTVSFAVSFAAMHRDRRTVVSVHKSFSSPFP